MKTILSIQSHVAYGYVGNRAATFPLQIMGYDVIAVNTVQFSNHAGYDSHTGMVFEPRHIEEVLAGIEERGLFKDIDAVISGYMGSAALGEIVLDTVEKIRAQNKNLTYCCDPVMGDTGRGFYVPAELQNLFREKGTAQADIITPNKFEIGHLAGTAIETLRQAQEACNIMHEKGSSIVLLTSLEVEETKSGEIQMLASHKNGRQWLITTPKLDMDPAPNGAGDMTSAIFTGRIIAGEPIDKALQNAAASIFGIFEKTQWLGQRELAIIQGQDCFKIDNSPFKATEL